MTRGNWAWKASGAGMKGVSAVASGAAATAVAGTEAGATMAGSWQR
jgi:hypothetical protein